MTTMPRSTEELIRSLAGQPVPAPLTPAAAAGRMGAAMLLCLAVFLSVAGFRPGLLAALESRWWVESKALLPLVLFLLALRPALGSARPGAPLRLWPLALPVAAGGALVLQRLATMGDAPVGSEMMGRTAFACVSLISLMAAAPLAVGLRALRRGAPTRPGLTGALLGLTSAAGVAAGYALHCPEDSPLFFVLWYGLAILLVTGAGAALGHRLLRW
jgi:hypothetical protein